jgi:hypothetical protein
MAMKSKRLRLERRRMQLNNLRDKNDICGNPSPQCPRGKALFLIQILLYRKMPLRIEDRFLYFKMMVL